MLGSIKGFKLLPGEKSFPDKRGKELTLGVGKNRRRLRRWQGESDKLGGRNSTRTSFPGRPVAGKKSEKKGESLL